jgi:hypothetical protein
MLGAAGAGVVATKSAGEAISSLDGFHVAAAVLDINLGKSRLLGSLPGSSGTRDTLRLLHWIRRSAGGMGKRAGDPEACYAARNR